MTFAGVIIFSAWRSIGYGVMIYVSALSRIPRDHYEAAKMEGSDWMHSFRFVTLPHLLPTIGLMFCLTIGSSATVYQTFDVMIGNMRTGAAKVFPLWINELAFQDRHQIGRASAVSFMYMLVMLVILLSTMLVTLRPSKDD